MAKKIKLSGVKDLLRQAYDFYKKNFNVLISLSLIAMGVFFMIGMLFGFLGGAGVIVTMIANKNFNLLLILLSLLFLIALLLIVASVIFQILAQTTLVWGIIRLRAKKKVSINLAWQKVGEKTKALVWLNVLTWLLFIAGYIFLIIPGVILSIWFTFAVIIFLNHKKKGMAALKASKNLVRGYFWPVLWRLIAINGVFVIITLFFSFVPWLGSIVNIALSVFAMPLIATYVYLVYENLLKIKGKI